MNEIVNDIFVKDKGLKTVIHYQQGTNALPLVFHYRDFDIPDGAESRLYARKPSGAEIYNAGSISENTITIPVTTQMTAEYGTVPAQLQIIKDTQILNSYLIFLEIDRSIISDSALESKDELTVLDELINEARDTISAVQQATEEATTQVAYAEEQGDYAKAQGDAAKTQAASAKAQASAAQTAAGKANTAATSANNAATSANNAANRANTAAGEVEDIVSDVNTAVSNKIDAEKGKALGLASLDSGKKVNETAKKADALTYNSTTVNADDLVITRGTNDKGDWIKFPDGTQICTMIKNITTDITDKWGYMYSSAEIDLGEYPLAFNTSYPVIRQISMAKGEKERSLAAMWYLGDTIFPSSTTPGGIHFYRTSSEAGVNVNVHILAIGRWR